MKLKLDDAGHAVLQDGKPVYVKDDGTEITFDAKQAFDKIGELTGQATGFRKERDSLKESLSKFGDIDPEKAQEALSTIANLDKKKLVDAGEVEKVADALITRLTGTDTRLGVIGGAGSLQVAPGGPRLVDGDGFPDAFKAEALELTRVLTELRASDDSLDWFFLSPAANFGAYNPGERTGHYRVGGDVLLTDEQGTSAISGEDLAVAVVDEIEQPAHRRERFTVAY